MVSVEVIAMIPADSAVAAGIAVRNATQLADLAADSDTAAPAAVGAAGSDVGQLDPHAREVTLIYW